MAKTAHEIVNESKERGGRTQRRAVCSCGWTSTWQAGDIAMAVNAGRWHQTHAIAQPIPAEWCGPAVTIDHTEIPTPDLEMALRSAALSPDGEVYPWRDLYPLVGQTVYAQGKLWIVASKEHGAGADSPIAVVQLVGCGHDEEATMARYELRPVSWSPCAMAR